MAQVVLSQLVEAEAQLAEQETIISAQLADLREKIKGLQTVMAMFDESSGEVNIEPPAAAAPEPESEPVSKPVVSPPPAKRRGRPRKTDAAKAEKTTTTRKKAAAKTVEKKPSAGRRGKAAKWQRYIRDEFSSTPLPDVVANILKSQPKSTFKIAAVMSEIFPEDMPKAQFLKARNRVSNILSAGARSREWYRGRGGTYSCSKKVLS